MAKPIPDGYHTVTPYLIVTNAVDAIEFYKRAFGATERMCLIAPDGKVAHGEIKIGDSVIVSSANIMTESPIFHGEIKIGDSVIMLADETTEFHSPRSFGGSALSIFL